MEDFDWYLWHHVFPPPGKEWGCKVHTDVYAFKLIISLNIRFLNQTASWIGKLRKQVTWSKCLSANHRLYGFPVLTWPKAEIHALCENAAVVFSLKCAWHTWWDEKLLIGVFGKLSGWIKQPENHQYWRWLYLCTWLLLLSEYSITCYHP